MKFLIIEDDSQKAEAVKTAIEAHDSTEFISICRSYQSGLRWLERKDNAVDFVILDMSLPTFDPDPKVRQGRPRPLGGYDLMRKLRRMGLSPAVIVLTALENFGSRSEQISFDELAEKCSEEFPNMFRGAIHYSQSKSGWRSELIGYFVGE